MLGRLLWKPTPYRGDPEETEKGETRMWEKKRGVGARGTTSVGSGRGGREQLTNNVPEQNCKKGTRQHA